jgi:hypothetical protein
MADPVSTRGVCGRRTGGGRRRDWPARSGCHSAPGRRGRARAPRIGGRPGHAPATGTRQRRRARVRTAGPRRSEGSAHRCFENHLQPVREIRPTTAAAGDRNRFVRSNTGRIMSDPPGPGGHMSRTRAPESRRARTRRPRVREAPGGDREERTLGERRGAARRGGPYVSGSDPGHAQRSEGDRDEQGVERSRLRQLDDPRGPAKGDDDIISVGIIVDSIDPGRIRRAGIGKWRHTGQADKDQYAQRAPWSHAAKPSPAAPVPSSTVA